MSRVLAIDPGPVRSAWLAFEAGQLFGFGIAANHEVSDRVARYWEYDDLAIEEVRSYGMPVGREVFDTVRWTGRFAERAWPEHDPHWLGRKDVVLHLCGSSRAKDSNVRQALLDRFGGKDTAVGRKAAPGPLYGVSGDVWAALALAVTYADGVR